MSETYTAVLDRIVDGEQAVLLLEGEAAPDRDRADEDESEERSGDGDRRPPVVDELVVGVDALPANGRHEGAVFEARVDSDGERLLEATFRADEEEKRRDSARERFDRLSERLPDE